MIYVCNLEEMPRHSAALKPSHLVSVVGRDYQPSTPPGLDSHRHLRMACDDIFDPLPGYVLPEAEHVEALIEFARTWNRAAPMLIHCQAGVSRSMAAALTVNVLHTSQDEKSVAMRLRTVAPHARPNPRIIKLADHLLDRSGRLVAAVQSMGYAQPIVTGNLVELALDN